jgi:tetratricopeptide (TPR) repeat protein
MTTKITTKEEALADLLHAAAFLAEGVASVDGMAEAMNEVVPRFLERGEVDMAAALADVTADPLTRDRLLVIVAEKCIEKRDDEYGMQLVEAIEDLSLSAGAMERVALKLIARGDFEPAFGIAATLGHPDEVFKSAAIERYKSGAFEEALQIASKVTVSAAKASLAMAFARTASENESTIEFENQIKNAERYALDVDLPEESATLLIELGNLCAELGRKDLAVRVFEKARETAETLTWPHRENLLGASAVGFFVFGSVTLADLALDLIDDKSVIARTLATFAHQMRKAGDKGGAVQALEEAFEILGSQKEREIRDYRANNNAWRAVALQFALSGEYDKSVKVVNEIPDPESRSAALSQCAVVFSDSDLNHDWRGMIDKIADPVLELATLIAIAANQSQKSDAESSQLLLDECVRRLNGIEQPLAACSILTDIFDSYSKVGEAEKAAQCLREALRTCSSIINVSNQAMVLARLSSKVDSNSFPIGEAETRLINSIIR